MTVPQPAGREATVVPEPEFGLAVVSTRIVAHEVLELELGDPAGLTLPSWTPGAHIDVVLPGDMIRQYSLCSDPADLSRYRIAVRREPHGRGGSAYLHDHARPGTTLGVRGPRNHFEFAPATGYLFIAGGIGITPLMPMVSAAEAAGTSWRMSYGGRSRETMAYLGRLGEMAGDRHDRLDVVPEDERGLLDLSAVLGEPRDGVLIYCCGPEPLVQAVEKRSAHWPTGSLRVERFAPREVEEPVRKRSFTVELVRSGLTVTVEPDQSILGAMREAGISVPTSCEEGTCGTCETSVLAGTVEHRDSILSAEEREASETLMICVSRARSDRLVLDF